MEEGVASSIVVLVYICIHICVEMFRRLYRSTDYYNDPRAVPLLGAKPSHFRPVLNMIVQKAGRIHDYLRHGLGFRRGPSVSKHASVAGKAKPCLRLARSCNDDAVPRKHG